MSHQDPLQEFADLLVIVQIRQKCPELAYFLLYGQQECVKPGVEVSCFGFWWHGEV